MAERKAGPDGDVNTATRTLIAYQEATVDQDLAHPPGEPTEQGTDAPVVLRLVPPSASTRPDTRVSVALALLGPVETALDDEATNALSADGISTKAATELMADPRYIIGRLHQALTALLAEDVPPIDATALLLSEAIQDAVTYRQRSCVRCDPDGTCCADCWPHWRKAGQYRALHGQLGIIDSLPTRPVLSVVRHPRRPKPENPR